VRSINVVTVSVNVDKFYELHIIVIMNCISVTKEMYCLFVCPVCAGIFGRDPVFSEYRFFIFLCKPYSHTPHTHIHVHIDV